jgi:hypothetical protein
MEFQQIPNFPGFCISKEGEVKNPNGKILNQHKNCKGYWRVNIPGHNTQFIHRLMGYTFIPNPENLPFIDHINRNREDNRIENLRWVNEKTNGENRGAGRGNSTGERYIYRMKNRHGNYKFVFMKQEGTKGQKKKTAEKWCDTLEEAILFRNAM